MPISAPRPCTHPGCGVLVRDGTGRCPKHPKQLWAKKPDAPKRITGRKLQRLRAELFARDPLCAECKRQGRVKLATQRDHIQSLEEGGADDDSNVQRLPRRQEQGRAPARCAACVARVHRALTTRPGPKGEGEVESFSPTPRKPTGSPFFCVRGFWEGGYSPDG